MRVGVLGAGSWGSALAQLLGTKGHTVDLWAYEPEVVERINADHQNPLVLSDISLSPNIVATGDLERAVDKAEMILFVIPAQLLRQYVKMVRDFLPTDAPLVICAKGIERKTLNNMDEVLIQELPGKYHPYVSVLSGPSFAAEVGRDMPTNVTVACRDLEVARRVQAGVATKNFRVHTTDDVVGVELGGALKNVMAIAVGAADGLGFGYNTRAASRTGFIVAGAESIAISNGGSQAYSWRRLGW